MRKTWILTFSRGVHGYHGSVDPKTKTKSWPPKILEPFTETSAKQRVLLIEDSRVDCQLIRNMIDQAAQAVFHVEVADTLERGLQRLELGGIELVLLDLSLPDSSKEQTFAKVHAIVSHIPIIILSGSDDQDFANQKVQEGAQDYLIKGQYDARLLLRSMRYAIKRKRAEMALAQERELLRALLHNIPDRIYFKDEQSRFIRINPALAAHFKLSDPHSAIGKTDFDFFTAEHAQAAFDDEQRILRTGNPVVGIVEKETHPDGRVTWAFTSKMPLRNKQGKIVGTFGVSRDITEIKNYENTLAGERNLLRSLIDNLPDYIYVKDAQGRYMLDNIAHRRLLGRAQEQEVIGKTPAEFFPPDVAAHYASEDQKALDGGRPLINREEIVADQSENRRWHSTTKVPLRDNEQHVAGLVCISRDITDQKEAEEELKRVNAELVRNREEILKVLADLKRSNEELRTAQSSLIQAAKLESVGTLAAGVAHEVKNPLQTILMGVDYLTEHFGVGNETVKFVLDEMREAIKRADSIVRGLLEFSATNQPNASKEDLNRVIEKSIGLIHYQLTKYRIQLVKDLSRDLPPFAIDKNKMEQVFINLFMNAIQEMPNGGTLTVRTRLLRFEETQPPLGAAARHFKIGDSAVLVEVDDTGPGIPEELLPKIFDPFFTTKPTGQGTGLGLPVTKKIIELHSGAIDVRNLPTGGGVRVAIWFRLLP